MTDIGMAEAGNGAGFAVKALAKVWVRGEVTGQDLDGNGAVQAGVAGTIHFAHSARAHRGLNLVRPEHRSGRECHSWMAIIASMELAVNSCGKSKALTTEVTKAHKGDPG